MKYPPGSGAISGQAVAGMRAPPWAALHACSTRFAASRGYGLRACAPGRRRWGGSPGSSCCMASASRGLRVAEVGPFLFRLAVRGGAANRRRHGRGKCAAPARHSATFFASAVASSSGCASRPPPRASSGCANTASRMIATPT